MGKIYAKIGLVILILVGIIFSLQWAGIANYRFFEPKRQDAQREVYENTQSFVEGKRQEIIKYHNEYMRTDDETTKNAILFTVRQTTANFDEDEYIKSEELRDFVKKAKYGK